VATATGAVGVAPVEYLATESSAAAAAVVAAAAYGNLNSMYPGASYAPSASGDPALSPYIGHTGSYHHQTLYPTTALDNR
jgi:aryl hydrocarbon receptor